MANPVIVDNVTLPSLGKVYNKEINPNVSLRSMTTADEMKRLGNSERPLQQMSSIIEDCLVDKPGIPVYDMILGDYTYLLMRLRIVTYGTKYTMNSICPFCGNAETETVDLDDLFVLQYNENIEKYREVDLPISQNHIVLRMQTPRMMDDIDAQIKDAKRYMPKDVDSAFLFTLKNSVHSVDGEVLDATRKEQYLKSLPMGDTNVLQQYIERLNNAIGFDSRIIAQCESCGMSFTSNFYITNEFFRPTLDI